MIAPCVVRGGLHHPDLYIGGKEGLNRGCLFFKEVIGELLDRHFCLFFPKIATEEVIGELLDFLLCGTLAELISSIWILGGYCRVMI
jgi:hypothetical protein